MEKQQSHILIFHYNGANRAFRPPKQVLKSAIRALCVKNSFANFCYNEGMLFFVISINTVLIMTCLFLSSFVHAQNSPSTDVHGCTTVEDGSNGLTVSIFPQFLSTLSDAFTCLLEKCAKFYFLKMQQLNKI